jgi:hypothetical protein
MVRPITSTSSLFTCIAIAILLATGCRHTSTVGEVKGTVTLDGQPLENGTIRLAPAEGRTSSSGGIIKNGQFTAEAAVGKYRVEISATKLAGGGPVDRHSSAVETVIQLIPEKYNTKSELTLDVKAGVNEPVFDLKSK